MSSKKKSAAIGLPNGWMREEIVRQNGLSRGKSDVYYYSPNGKKFRSKPELIRFLGPKYDLTCFDYRSGKIVLDKAKPVRRTKPYETKSNKVESDISLPNRQTASIFKQPVTTKTNHKSNKVKSDQSRSGSNPPQQLFREKRLSGLKAVDIAESIIECMDLPRSIQAVPPVSNSEDLLRRIASQIHQSSGPIVGQASFNANKDPCVWINTQQPVCKSFLVTEDDIRKQEHRVLSARKRLVQALEQDADHQLKTLISSV